MVNEVPLLFDGFGVSVTADAWNDLVSCRPAAFNDVIGVIKQKVADGQHFIIQKSDGSIARRIDRMSELRSLIEEVNEQWESLHPVEYPDPADDSEEALDKRFKASLADKRT